MARQDRKEMNWRHNLADFISVQVASENILLVFPICTLTLKSMMSLIHKADFAEQTMIFVIILVALSCLLPSILMMM